MGENKKAIIGTVVTVVVLAGAGGILVLKAQHKTALSNANISQASAGQTSSTNIPLNSAAGNADSGGLSVGTGSATGQLSTGNQSGTQSANNANGSSSSSSSQGIDPSSFAQYDKYKNEQHALFGEIKVGDGDTLTAGKKAAVYYKGWLTNGTLFDESRPGSDGQTQPFVFQLGAHQVIPGWEEGTAGMKVGGTRLLIVPPAVGYGAQSQGNIPANSVLVFEVQLAAVQ